MDETLIEAVANETGLNQDTVESIIKKWVLESGKSPQDLRLEDFREVLVKMVQDLFTEVASGENEFIQVSRSVFRL
jgi:hypothetical protein